MTKKFTEQQKNKLKEHKKKLEAQLNSFAKKSDKGEGNWDVPVPSFDGGNLEEEADEVEEFSTLLALEKTLEGELKKINLALDKLKKGKYGICDKCNKPISQGRLNAYPRAEHCTKCQ